MLHGMIIVLLVLGDKLIERVICDGLFCSV